MICKFCGKPLIGNNCIYCGHSHKANQDTCAKDTSNLKVVECDNIEEISNLHQDRQNEKYSFKRHMVHKYNILVLFAAFIFSYSIIIFSLGLAQKIILYIGPIIAIGIDILALILAIKRLKGLKNLNEEGQSKANQYIIGLILNIVILLILYLIFAFNLIEILFGNH